MSDDSSERRRVGRRLIYRGRVQGVGFRYTAASIARRFSVRGYVKNLADGTVELVLDAEGGPSEAFLKAIEAAFHGYVDECLSEGFSLQEQFSGFEIRY